MINTPKVYNPTLSMCFSHWLSDKPFNEGRIGLAFDLTIGYLGTIFRPILDYF
tara:strand:+ start:380 stop:538 length:159 start_codon:yes stop_codon:yes gene_type:complete